MLSKISMQQNIFSFQIEKYAKTVANQSLREVRIADKKTMSCVNF